MSGFCKDLKAQKEIVVVLSALFPSFLLSPCEKAEFVETLGLSRNLRLCYGNNCKIINEEQEGYL